MLLQRPDTLGWSVLSLAGAGVSVTLFWLVVRGVGGECGALRYQHRVKDGAHFYLIVNESPARTACAGEFGGGQPAEIWDADGGGRRAVRVEGRAAALEFEPWEAYYVLLGTKGAAAPERQPAR